VLGQTRLQEALALAQLAIQASVVASATLSPSRAPVSADATPLKAINTMPPKAHFIQLISTKMADQ
jgi:hypothetical protein